MNAAQFAAAPEVIAVETESFSIPDAMVLFQPVLTRGLVREFEKAGILRASVTPSSGKGRKRRLSFSDLFAIHLACSLKRAGLSLKMIKRAVDAYFTTEFTPGRRLLAITGNSVEILTADEAIERQSRGQAMVGCDLIVAAHRLRAEIETQRAMVKASRAAKAEAN